MNRAHLLSLLFSASLFACVGAEGESESDKPKPELGDDFKTTFDAVEPSGGGRWTELQLIDTAHPYTNRFTRSWTVTGNSDTTEMRVVLERFETEAGYDFVAVEGANGQGRTELSGNRTGQEVSIPGARVTIALNTDASVTGWGFRARVFRREPCICPAIHMPVCGSDGRDYGSPCAAQCAGATVVNNGTCGASQWARVNFGVQSAHPYTNRFDNTWTLSEGGATSIRAHFSRIDTERGYDFVRVLDSNNRVVASYSGSQTNITTPSAPGSQLKIQLVSDGSVTAWGFQVDWYEVAGGCNTDADCGSGNHCQQITCIRAPCFNHCEPNTNGYTDVTTAQLESDPAAWIGIPVRVVAEPGAPGAACTRRACQPSQPCCNVCNATIHLSQNIPLYDSSGAAYGCQGDECSWRATCRQFQPENNGRYSFEGTLGVDSFGNNRFVVDTFTAVDCQRGGCSGQMCSNVPGAISTCEFRPEYACYQQASCEAQGTGHCGFTQTPELLMCLQGAQAEVFTATDTPLSIPDNNTTGITSRIGVLPSAAVVGELRVSLNIRHTYKGDLRVTLLSPSGRSTVLHDKTGGSTDDVILSDVPVTAFAGEARTGSWSLRVIDSAAADIGTIQSFSLRFN